MKVKARPRSESQPRNGRRADASRSPGAELEQPVFLLGRAFSVYSSVLEQVLIEARLAGRVRPGMGNALFALFEKDNQTVSEVARRLGLSKSTMTDMVARIRQAGLVRTVRDQVDGRAIRLRLTRRARLLEPRCRRVARRMDEIAGGRLTANERTQLRILLTKLIGSLTDELEGIRHDC